MQDDLQDVNVAIASQPDADTILVTGDEQVFDCDEMLKRRFAAAVSKYDPTNSIYDVYTKDSSSNSITDISTIDDLAVGANNDIDKVLKINSYVRGYVLTNDIIGRVHEALTTVTSTEFKLNYPRMEEKEHEKVSEIIDNFNKQINIVQAIRDAVPMTYLEGNRIYYLRNKADYWALDTMPLGTFYQSEYTLAGKPVVLCDINGLKTALEKTYKKTKKTRKAIILENVAEDIKQNYPDEVYKGYITGEQYVKLDPRYCDTLRVNNLGRRFGVTPIFRALKSAVMLSNMEQADQSNSKARQKKIIHQVMRKELLGSNGTQKGHADMAFAHEQLMSAWKNKTVVYTSPAAVEKIVYVEPSASDTTVEKINEYRSRILSTLGIGFSDATVENFSVAQISFEQLMKYAMVIAEQFETMMDRFYAVVLEKNGVDVALAPTIKIADGSEMEIAIRKELSSFVAMQLNGSYRTAYELIGIDYDTERMRRQKENEEGDYKTFFARDSAYTKTGDSEGAGRPASNEDVEKQAIDKARNRTSEVSVL